MEHTHNKPKYKEIINLLLHNGMSKGKMEQCQLLRTTYEGQKAK